MYRRPLAAALCTLALGLASGCGDDDQPLDAASVDGAIVDAPVDVADAAVAPPPIDATDAPPLPDASAACNSTVTGFPLAQGAHVTLCSDVTYPTNPPTSGAHYPAWAAYKTYTTPVRHGFLVHDLEHGAVIISYNCGDTPCDDELAALAAFLDALPPDPLCSSAVTRRIVVTPDPDLDVRFAAASWGFALRSECFDLAALGSFLDEHYADAPENLCSQGLDVGVPGQNCD